MRLTIPELSLVVLIGASGSGKSTFARNHFKATEILSSDFCRALVSDDENEMAATGDAFEVLHYIAAKRLARGKLTVIDATSVKKEDRAPLVELARRYHVLPVAIALNLPEKLCHERNRERPDRAFGPHVVRQHTQQIRRSLGNLKREGFRQVYVLSSLAEVDSAEIERQPLWNNRKSEHGPFDIIGDIHGCADELEELLRALGYQIVADTSGESPWGSPLYRHPDGRRAIFVGDLIDRGPRILDTVRIVRAMVEAGDALCLPGNHDMKLLRKLRGRDVQITHGLDSTLREIDSLGDARDAFSAELAAFLDSLVSHYVFDDGKLVVAHAGMKEEMQGRGSGAVRNFALYGETTGETDEFGLPVRVQWAAEYRGKAMVVYGHTPVTEPEWLNNTINIDTGCIYGGSLTAMRYPEKELVSIPAHRTYYEPAKPFLADEDRAPALDAQQRHDDLLDLDDVMGKRIIATRLHRSVTIREENATAALEVMSRFAINPKWLIYLPPTMAPTETTSRPDLLEHPTEAFAYYRREGVGRVICEEKHMGSRAILVICRDAQVARNRFGIEGEEFGVCYTRTGRPFFTELVHAELLNTVRHTIDNSGLWEELETDWVCLDCELMPWSAKAQDLLRQQYAPVGAAGHMDLTDAAALLAQAASRGVEVGDHLVRLRERTDVVDRYVTAYGQYCWPVESVADLKLAPFHLLASEGRVHIDRDHCWHLAMLERLHPNSVARSHVSEDTSVGRRPPWAAGHVSQSVTNSEEIPDTQALIYPTKHLVVDVTDPTSEEAGVLWWEKLTESGGEGMVVKPLEFVTRGSRGLVQPALKCRGREYLRIIYGPEYTLPENIERLRARNVGAKRSLASREFALGIEGLERFVRREPLRRVHECVFGVLALESEPVDPRL